MNFLGNLGIDVKLLMAQIVNFALLLWLLSKFLYKPIVDRVEKDETELKQAETLKDELEKEKKIFNTEQTEGRNSAGKKAKDIIEEAESIAEKIKSQSRSEAEKEKEAVIKQIKDRLTEVENGENNKK